MAAVERRLITAIIAGGVLLGGCAARNSSATSTIAQAANASILVSSHPAAGTTVRAPIDELRFRFNPPARLDEVTVSGPDGIMPTKVAAVGEVADYAIPLPGLDPGHYKVEWRANAQGRAYRGSFEFTAK